MTYCGVVIHGLQNGRKFGFPTANVHLETIPDIEKGVYAVVLEVLGRKYKGMLYVGTRPTLDLQALTFEINILDFNRNIYDQILSFDIVEKVRDERKFDNTTQLIEQLRRDRKEVRTLLAAPTRRLARKQDLPQIMEIIRQAQKRLFDLHINQWQDGYPNEEVILKDIQNKCGHVFVKKGIIVAYAAILFTPDPYYEHISGQWLTNHPYVVVHRIAVSDANAHTGVGRYIILQADKMAKKNNIKAFRIDTHQANHYMRNLIRNTGFTLCGIVKVRDGQRLAYEKNIQ